MKEYEEKLNSLLFWAPGGIISLVLGLIGTILLPYTFPKAENLISLKVGFLVGSVSYMAFACIVTLISGIIRYQSKKEYKNFRYESIFLMILAVILLITDVCLWKFLIISRNVFGENIYTFPFTFPFSHFHEIIYLVLFTVLFAMIILRLIINHEINLRNVLKVFSSLLLIFLYMYIFICMTNVYGSYVIDMMDFII